MAVIHNGREAPLLPGAMNPDDAETFFISWEDRLNGSSITSSAWVLPAGFTEVSDETDTTATEVEDGVTTIHLNCNGVTVTTTQTEGVFEFDNVSGFADGRSLTRGLKVRVYDN